MVTYKFLAKGARGPVSGFAWPRARGNAPGAWVEVEGPLTQCAHGVHVCRTFDLAHWIHDELWELEVDGDQIEGTDCIVVRRARLVRRIAAWGAPATLKFAEACVEHAVAYVGAAAAVAVRELLDDARFMATNGYVALSAFTAALVVSRASDDAAPAYRRERAWQSACIADRMLAPQHP